AQGRTVDFRNSIVIMTSNIGANEIAKNTGVGFTVSDETGLSYDDMRTRIMSELKKVFRPEFLNRIDEVIVFHKLAKAEVREIVELLLKRIRESLAERELSLNLSDDAADLLVEKGWDPSMGARPLRRAIQRYIEDPLADEVLAHNAEPGSTVEVDKADGDAEAIDGEGEDQVKITIVKPREREAVGVGGGVPEGPEDVGSTEESAEGSSPGSGDDLPAEPDVLPDVPDAPPATEGDSQS
ncbi:MAG: AAA family ATPase, partial [Actinomycetota bacterium]|nr:AAA family ATPase [Actinomycetota bacterium]